MLILAFNLKANSAEFGKLLILPFAGTAKVLVGFVSLSKIGVGEFGLGSVCDHKFIVNDKKTKTPTQENLLKKRVLGLNILLILLDKEFPKKKLSVNISAHLTNNYILCELI
jgi:hypothetical protein